MSEQIKINEEFCFNSSKKLTIKIAHEALNNYANKFEAALNLDKSSIPIILDTNVLLAYYGLSQSEKDELIKFLNQNQERLYLTSQIEKEFLKNRIRTINKDFFTPLNRIQQDFQSTYTDIRNKFKSFMEGKKNTLSNDYPKVWELLLEKQKELDKILDDEENLKETLEKAIDATKTDHKNIYVVDKLLEACSQLNITPPLDDEELEFIQKQYDTLLKNYPEQGDEIKRQEAIFPGYGDKDKKDKQDKDPYGDFIIFHEILKFMAGHHNASGSQDVIFLTHEKSKGDWMKSDRSPIVHYIEKAYLVTGQSLFILHAEPLLKISFENIHKSNQSSDNELIIRESTIVSLNFEKKWGFIYSKDGNLYFHQSFLKDQEEFQGLSQHDVVRYQIGKNQDGGNIAINVEKVVYSFDDQAKAILNSYISRIDKDKGYGFIAFQPENLYFHCSFLKDPQTFNNLEVNSNVEFIVGKNEFGEDIARLVRKASPSQNELELE
jgi:cold shock CspA family protein